MVAPLITPLPPAPSRQDDPDNFVAKADALLGALDEFVSDANTQATFNDGRAAAADASAQAAAQSAIDATNNGAAQVALAAAQAVNSANSATASANSAAAALVSQNAASGSASAAQTAQLAAELALDQFDDKYLGAKNADPTVDNDGNPLQAGAFYINTISGFLRVYTGTEWVQGISAVAGVESINAQQGALSLKTIDGQSLLGSGDVQQNTFFFQSTGIV